MKEVMRVVMLMGGLLAMGAIVAMAFSAWRMSRDAGKVLRSNPVIADADEFQQRMELRAEEHREHQREVLQEMRRHNALLEQQTQVQSKVLERLDALLAQRDRGA